MKRTRIRYTAPVAFALVAALGLSACGAGNEDDSEGDAEGASGSNLTGELNGAGASSQESAVAAWQAGFQSLNPEVTVNYDPVGSSGGREQFIAGGLDFAGSDALMDDEELKAAQETCGGDVVEVPVYVSPIAVIFNVEGVDELNLTAETIGGIFAGDITTWDDEAIAADNPDADLPDTDIVPVHRADGSGTTENFLDYLDQASGGSWKDGVSDEWPIDGGEAAESTSGVVQAVKGGDGTIGYADASQADDLGVAKIQVGEEFVEYTPEAAAKAIDTSPRVEGRGDLSVAVELDRESTESGVYPVSLLSYAYSCAKLPADKADLVKSYLEYVVSEEGQADAAETAGSAPMSAEMSAEVGEIVSQISAK